VIGKDMKRPKRVVVRKIWPREKQKKRFLYPNYEVGLGLEDHDDFVIAIFYIQFQNDA
jgi:hypothetical protein